MPASPTGILGPPIIDGYLLDQAAVYGQDVVWNPTEEVVRMQPSGRARQGARYNGAGYPLNGGWYEITLRYQHIRGELDRISALLNAPGDHELVFWRRDTWVYAGDGDRVVFYLPFAPAVNDAAGIGPWNVPGSFAGQAARLATEVQTGIGGTDANGVAQSSTTFTTAVKDAGAYAGSPSAGEAWFLDDGTQFKVGTAPLSGQRLYLRMVPIVPVFRQGRTEVKAQAPTVTRESRDIVLVGGV